MEVVNGFENLLDRLGSIFLCKFSVFADPVEQLPPSGQLGDYVVFVLYKIRLLILLLLSSSTQIPSIQTNRETARCWDASFFAAGPSHHKPFSHFL